MECKQCNGKNVSSKVRQGKPVKIDGDAYWLQVFTCNDPKCPNFEKDIGEKRTNIFDESKVEEVYC